MKTVKLLLTSIIILFVINSNAQDAYSTGVKIQKNTARELTSFNLHRKIELKDDSETKEIKIEVSEKECRFNLRIKSKINAGEVKLEIYDPNGKKEGNFSLGCQIPADNALIAKDAGKSMEEVNGATSLLKENASIGIWKVKIIPQNAVGNVIIEFSQNI